MAEQIRVETKEITLTLGKRKILDKISIALEAGRFVAIIGPNGSGKSSLLKIIYRIYQPDSGCVCLNGTDIRKLSLKETARQIAVMAQSSPVSFEFTVGELVRMGRTPYKKLMEFNTQQDEQLVEDALKKVGMFEQRNQKYGVLSGGEKQRVLFARAMVQQPKLFILDEPTNNLDIRYQAQLMNLVRELPGGVLAVLHDLNLTLAFCDEVYVMKDGRIVADGKPEEVITERLIQKVYEADSTVIQNPTTGRLHVMFHYETKEMAVP